MKRLLILAVLACSLVAYAAECPATSVCQPGDKAECLPASVCQPGDKVAAKLLSTDENISRVILAPGNGAARYETSLDGSRTDRFFLIPANLANGTYSVQITTAKSDTPIDGISPRQIVVERPTITAVSPKAAFRDKSGTHEMTILGSGFREHSTFNLRFKDIATPNCIPNSTTNCPPNGTAKDATNGIHCTKPSSVDKPAIDKPAYCLEWKSENEIRLFFYLESSKDYAKEYYSGPREFTIEVDKTPTNPATLTLINATSDLPMTVAIIGLVLIIVVVYLLIQSGKTVLTQTFGKKTYLLSALFLDVQTYSYSLSKCQFYIWTLAAVFGYIFLAISKSYVQGSAVFPDIPSGLPGILLASAGTAVLATGITSAKGDKGAGSPRPELSDFIATGGVVAADRLQFAIWTIVGVGTFLAIILRSDPRSIDDLPAIPNGFLQLMGISAGGYIAGKIARKPGPTIDAIAISSPESVSGTPPSIPEKLVFRLTGKGLAQAALFSIDESQIYPDTIEGKSGRSKPDVVEQDPAIGDPQYARVLSVTCTQAKKEWLGGPHSFTVTNPDAQKSTVTFQIFKVIDIKLTKKDLTITGECLDARLNVQCMQGNQKIDLKDIKSTATRYEATFAADLDEDKPVNITVADTAGVVIGWQGVKVEKSGDVKAGK